MLFWQIGRYIYIYVCAVPLCLNTSEKRCLSLRHQVLKNEKKKNELQQRKKHQAVYTCQSTPTDSHKRTQNATLTLLILVNKQAHQRHTNNSTQHQKETLRLHLFFFSLSLSKKKKKSKGTHLNNAEHDTINTLIYTFQTQNNKNTITYLHKNKIN